MSDQLDTRTGQEGTEHRPVTVIINGTSYEFATDDVTGRQIKEKAGIPLNYSLYLRRPGGNEPISDGERVELREGEHFFSRPPSNVS